MAEADRRLHVLVADDEPHIGRIIKMKLEQGPFSVTLAYDGSEALAAANADSELALALLDVMMPKMSGLDVLAKLRAEGRHRALPCIILTAAGQEQHYRQAMALGASRRTVSTSSGRFVTSGRSCFGLDGVESGQKREPTPPARITAQRLMRDLLPDHRATHP